MTGFFDARERPKIVRTCTALVSSPLFLKPLLKQYYFHFSANYALCHVVCHIFLTFFKFQETVVLSLEINGVHELTGPRGCKITDDSYAVYFLSLYQIIAYIEILVNRDWTTRSMRLVNRADC